LIREETDDDQELYLLRASPVTSESHGRCHRAAVVIFLVVFAVVVRIFVVEGLVGGLQGRPRDL
jgi:hypothetical protein